MSSKYFEESERYFREYEVKNGLGREYLDQGKRMQGSPCRYEHDYNRQPDWSSQRYTSLSCSIFMFRNGYSNPPHRSRHTSIPPTVRLPYNVGSQSQPPPIGNRYQPSYQSPYAGRYVPSGGSVPIEKASDTKRTHWPYTSPEFNPRSYYDRYEAERPVNKGPLLEGTHLPFPPTAYSTTFYPTSSPTQHNHQTVIRV